MAKICQIIESAKLILPWKIWLKIFLNHQSSETDFALTNLTKIQQNHQIHEHSLGLIRFCQICHFHYLVHFWTLKWRWRTWRLTIISNVHSPLFSNAKVTVSWDRVTKQSSNQCTAVPRVNYTYIQQRRDSALVIHGS